MTGIFQLSCAATNQNHIVNCKMFTRTYKVINRIFYWIQIDNWMHKRILSHLGNSQSELSYFWNCFLLDYVAIWIIFFQIMPHLDLCCALHAVICAYMELCHCITYGGLYSAKCSYSYNTYMCCMNKQENIYIHTVKTFLLFVFFRFFTNKYIKKFKIWGKVVPNIFNFFVK